MRDGASVEVKRFSQNTAEHKPALNRETELQKIRREVLTISDLAKKLADRIDGLIATTGSRID